MRYPLIDEYMTYDYDNHRYVLTKKDLLDNFNENLQTKFKDEKDIEPFLKNISREVYSFIHKFNSEDLVQDFILANTKSGRRIIKEALECQAIYELRNGNLLYSAQKDAGLLAYAPELLDILSKTIPEIGVPIIYMGIIMVPPCLSENVGEW